MQNNQPFQIKEIKEIISFFVDKKDIEKMNHLLDSIKILNHLNISLLELKNKGFSSKSAIKIQKIFEFAFKINLLSEDMTKIKCSEDAYNQLKYISSFHEEHFVVIFVNNGNEIIKNEIISIGSSVGCIVSTQVIIKKALEYKAKNIFIAHNHPSGNIRPSNADNTITKKVKEACKLFDINLLDHIIVGNNKYYSYRDETNILN